MKPQKIRLVSDGVGGNCKLYLNGVEIQFATSFQFEATVGEPTKVTISTFHPVEIEGEVGTVAIDEQHINIECPTCKQTRKQEVIR